MFRNEISKDLARWKTKNIALNAIKTGGAITFCLQESLNSLLDMKKNDKTLCFWNYTLLINRSAIGMKKKRGSVLSISLHVVCEKFFVAKQPENLLGKRALKLRKLNQCFDFYFQVVETV